MPAVIAGIFLCQTILTGLHGCDPYTPQKNGYARRVPPFRFLSRNFFCADYPFSLNGLRNCCDAIRQLTDRASLRESDD
jgi:hypothetical protein